MANLEAQNMVIADQDSEPDLPICDSQSQKNKTSQKPQQNSLIRMINYLFISIFICPIGVIAGESDGPGYESWLSSLPQAIYFNSLSHTLLICKMGIITVPIQRVAVSINDRMQIRSLAQYLHTKYTPAKIDWLLTIIVLLINTRAEVDHGDSPLQQFFFVVKKMQRFKMM